MATAANTKALILNISGAQSLVLKRGEKNTVKAKAGQRYRVVKEGEEEGAKDVAASQQGQDLVLTYTDGTQVILDGFYEACKAEQCAIDMPGAKGTGSNGGYVITGDSAVGASLSNGNKLVYAFGDTPSMASLTKGAEQAQGMVHANSFSTYIPTGHGAAWTPLKLALGAAGIGALLSSDDTAVPVPTVIHGNMVAGPVLAGNGLTAVAYKADGTVLASAAVNADGTFTLNLGNDYLGPVLVKVSDTNLAVDYFDEATGAPKDLTTDLRALTVLPAAGTYNVSVNVLTELAVRILGLSGGDAGNSSTTFASVNPTQIVQANQKVAAAVGLTQNLVLDAAPVAIITTTGANNPQSNDYGRLLAAMSGAEVGSDTNAVLVDLTAKLQNTQSQATSQVLETLLEGAALVNLVAAISDITNQKSTAITIDAVSQDNRLSPAEMIAGVQVQGSAASGATVALAWSDSSGNAQATGTRTVTADSQGRWTTSFTSAEMPALGATTLKATVGSAVATRSIFLDEPLAPTITLTGNGRVGVSGILSGAGWDYSTDGGTTWTAGSGDTFNATGDGAKQVLVRLNIGGHTSPSSNRLDFVLDTTAPSILSMSLPTGSSNSGAVTVTGVEAGASWQYSTNRGSTWTTGTGTSFTLGEASYAAETIQVRQTDAAGNTSAVASSTAAITIDTTAPTVSVSSSATSLGANATATVTFTLSEPSTDFNESDVSVTGGTLSNFAGSGTSYTATFTPDAGLSGAATVNVASSAMTDAAGNSNSVASNTVSITVDTQAPTVASITTNQSSLRAGQTANLSITLSEASTSFSLADLQAVGGTLSNFSGSGSSYSVTFTPNNNRTEPGSVTIAPGVFTDSAGNTSVAGSADGVIMAISTVRPSATLVARQTTLGVGEVTTIDITLSEKSSDFTVEDLTASNGALSSFTSLGNGTHYSVVFTPSAPFTGTGGVTLADGRFTNASGNPNGGGEQAASTGSLAIDTTPPTVTITSNVTALAIGQSATITFTFNKDPGNSFDASDISVNGGTLGKLTNHTGTVWTAVFTPADGTSGQASISVASGRYTDASGNNGAAGTTPALTFDAQGPQAELYPASNTTVLPGKSLVLNFSEAVRLGNGNMVLVNDTDNTRSTVTLTSSMLSQDGKTLTITPPVALVAGKQYHVEADPGSLLDLAGNAWAGIASSSSWAGSGWRFTAATPSVSLNTIAIDGQVNGTENTAGVVIGGSIESNTAGMVADFVAGNFTVTLTPQGGGSTISATATSYNGTTGAWSLTLAPNALVTDKTYAVSVSVTGSTGLASGATASTSGSVVVDLTAAAPTLALLADTGASISDGITRNATVTVAGLEDGAIWQYSTNNGTNWLAGSGSQFTATGADGNRSVLVRQTDKAGNTSSPTTLNFTLDTLADRPVIQAVTSDNILNASETGSAITGTAEAGATIQLVLGSGKESRKVTATADSNGDWSYTLVSADLAALGSGQTQITAAQTDKAGNRSFQALHNFVLDNQAPTVTLSSDRETLSFGQTATITLNFSEDPGASFVWNGSSGDLTVLGGTLSALSGSGLTRTATFTPTAGSTTAASIAVTGAFTDTAGNAGQTSEPLKMNVDTVLPTVAVSASTTTLGPGAVSTLTFTLSEASDSFSADSVTVVGGTLGPLSANAARTVYTGVFTPDASFFGNGSVSVASGALRDAGGNTNTDGSDTNNSVALTIQAAPTTLAITSDKDTLKAGETATFTFTFSSAPTGFAASDIAVTGGTLSGLTVNPNNAALFTATFTPTANVANGLATVSVMDGSYTGQGGNAGRGAKLATLRFDTQAPTLLTLNPDDNGFLAAQEGASLVATFSKEVLAGTGNIRLVNSTTNTTETFALDSAALNFSGDTLTITPTTALVAGQNYYLSIDSTALVDRAGNAYAGIANATTWNFSASNLAATLNPAAGDGLVNMAEKAAAMAGNGLQFSGTVSSANPAVLSALQASDIVVRVTLPDRIDNDGGPFKVFTMGASSYNSTTGAWTAEMPKTWTYTEYSGFLIFRQSSTQTRDSLGNGHTDSISVTVTGRSGTAAAGLTVTLNDSMRIDLSAPATPTLSLASDTGSSTSDEITRNGLINVGGLESGASWSYSLDNGSTWQTGAGTSFALTRDGATTVQVMQTDAAGNASAVQSMAVTLDSQASAPVINAVASDNRINASETGSAITGNAEADASVSLLIGGNTRTVTANDSGVWSYTLQSTDITAMGQGAEVISVTQTDKAGNISGAGTAVVNIDTAAPTATLTSSSTSLLAGQSATITLTFSEQVPGILASMLTVSGGTLGELQADASGLVYTGTFTPNVNSTTSASIQLASGAASDAASNANSSASNALAISVNTVLPTVAITSSATGTLYAGDSATLTFTLSQASTDFTASDVMVKGGTLSNFAGSGTSYTATFTPDANSTAPGKVSVLSSAFSNAAGNTNADGADIDNSVSFAIATVRPSLTISSDVGTLAGGQTANITFSFSEDPGSSFAWNGTSGDITVSGGTLSAILGAGLTRTATFTPTAGFAGAASITVANGSYTNANGSLGQAAASPALTIDAVAPTVAISRSASGTLGVGQTDTITFDFSEAPGSSFTLADIDVSGGTLAGLSAVSATRYVATFTPTANATGTAKIGMANARFTDLAGNANADGGDANNLLSLAYNTGGSAPTALTLSLAADTGTSRSDGITGNGFIHVAGLSAATAWEYTLNGLATTPVWVSGNGSSFTLAAGTYAAGAVKVRQSGSEGSLAAAVVFIPRFSGQLSIALETNTGNGTPGATTDGVTSLGAMFVNGLSSGDTWRHSLDNGRTWSASSAAMVNNPIIPTISAGTDQQINVLVEATDMAGNTSTAKFNYRLDNRAPAEPNFSVSTDGTGTLVAPFNIELGAVVNYRFWSAGQNPSNSWSNTYTPPTTPGAYTLEVRTLDLAGNVSSAVRNFSIAAPRASSPGINLSDIAAGSGGFVINGQCAWDASGVSVSSAGDVNGDGLADLIVGANWSDPATGTEAGRSYVVFGKSTGTGIDLSAVAAGSGGFVINGQVAGDQSGSSVSSAGDVNGDGLADLIVGARFNNAVVGANAGRSYVVFGKSSGTGVDLSAVVAGSGGFVINGQCRIEYSGESVSSAGDVNGDGLADLIVGANMSSPSAGANAGRSYVVFGKSTGTGIDLSAVAAGNGGFVINGQCQGDQSGVSVSSAGDVNGDGLADLIVGAFMSDPATGVNAGRSYVVFGKSTGTGINLSAVAAGSGGFVINGQCVFDLSGNSVSSAGDVNGDGLADLIVGARSSDRDPAIGAAGRSYVVFGKSSGTGINLSAVAAGSGGFVIIGEILSDESGVSVSNAGDINGDGLSDLIVGAKWNDPATGRDAGRSYVVFGKSSGSGINLSAVAAGSGGFVVNGQFQGDQSGGSVSSAGDVNGDGFADLIVGASWSDPAAGASAGRSYVIFGSTAGGAGTGTLVDWLGTAGDDTQSDSGTAKTLVAGAGNDVLTATAASVLMGGAGNDRFSINQTMATALQSALGMGGNTTRLSRVDGGTGLDTLVLVAGTSLDLTRVANASGGDPEGTDRVASIERIDLSAAGTSLTLSATDVAHLAGMNSFNSGNGWAGLAASVPRHQLIVTGTAGTLSVSGNWGFVGTISDGSTSYNVYNGDRNTQLLLEGGRTLPSTAIHLSAIAAGSGGFVINGQCMGDQSGVSVSGAGDVNGDGLADLIVGAFLSDPAAGQSAGRSYVVFGKSTGTGIDLSAVAAGNGGFVINGQGAGDQSGVSVSSAGDVNGDGLADLIVGANQSAPAAGPGAGRSYVVFGKSTGTGINLSAVAAGNGGFVINGQCWIDYSGYSVSSAGDVNGDGLADLIVGAFLSDPAAGADAGRSYVVFGRNSGAGIDLSAVAAGRGGFVINGQFRVDYSGNSVSAAGDVNGDGLADLIVGANRSDPAAGADAGRSYVVFGKSTGTGINLSAVAAGSGGFVINGQCAHEMSGTSVSAAGDVNGDGLADLIVGAHISSPATGAFAGRSYVVFGKSTGTGIDLSAVAAGSGGFVINGQSAGDYSGVSVSSAGDVNGDGLADLIVGASTSDPAAGSDAGRSYVVFGKSSGTGIDLSAVSAGSGGFVINGQCLGDSSGYSVSGAGDINGDGLADLIVGAYLSDPAAGLSAGRSYVIFGSTSNSFMPSTLVQMGSASNDSLSDNGAAQLLVGGAGNDTLTATAASVLRGGSGSDTFVVNQAMVTALQTAYGQTGNNGAYNASIDGGEGGINSVNAGLTASYQIDRLSLSGTGIALDLTQISNAGRMDPEVSSRLSGIEVIQLGAASNSLKLTARDVLDLSDAVDLTAVTGQADARQLVVMGPAGATVDLADGTGTSGWNKLTATTTGTNWGDTSTYAVWEHSGSNAMLLVHRSLSVI